jgi:hypothetical protein
VTEETEEAEQAETGSEEAPAAPSSAEVPEDDWTPPREILLLLAGLAALACAGAVIFGVEKKWTLPTLGVLLAGGLAEALVAVGLAIRIAFAAHRRLGLYVGGVIVTVLATISLVGILLLSGII